MTLLGGAAAVVAGPHGVPVLDEEDDALLWASLHAKLQALDVTRLRARLMAMLNGQRSRRRWGLRAM